MPNKVRPPLYNSDVYKWHAVDGPYDDRDTAARRAKILYSENGANGWNYAVKRQSNYGGLRRTAKWYVMGRKSKASPNTATQAIDWNNPKSPEERTG